MTSQTPIPIESTDVSASSPARPASDANVSDFAAAWDDATMEFAEDSTTLAVTPAEPSVLSGIAHRSSEIFANAVSSMDFNAIRSMSTMQAISYATQHQIDLSYAKALMTLNWNVLKTARQSVDTVMNSK